MNNIILHPFELRELSANNEVELIRPVDPTPPQFTTIAGTVDDVGAVWPLDEQERKLRCALGNPGEESRVLEEWGYLGCSTMGDVHKAFVMYLVDDVRREVPFLSFKEMCADTPEQNIEYPDDFEELEEWERESMHDKLLNKWWKDIKQCAAATMPKWACRSLFKVYKVRCARLTRVEWRRDVHWDDLYPDFPADSNPWCWVAVGTRRTIE